MSAEHSSKSWLPLLAAGLVMAWVFLAIQKQPGEIAYCAECAVQSQTESWGLSFPKVTVYRRTNETPTLISRVLTGKHLVGSHPHRWLPPRIAPNPINLYGPPVVLSLGFLNTPQVAGLLNNLADFADPTNRDNVRELVLRPEYSYLVNHSLRFLKFPPRGFQERGQFLAWWSENGFTFYQHLREETEPD